MAEETQQEHQHRWQAWHNPILLRLNTMELETVWQCECGALRWRDNPRSVFPKKVVA